MNGCEASTYAFRYSGEHRCECERESGHPGRHSCGMCGFAWIDQGHGPAEPERDPEGWADLWRILDTVYPEDMIPTRHVPEDDGNGPQVIALLRLLGRAEARLSERSRPAEPERAS